MVRSVIPHDTAQQPRLVEVSDAGGFQLLVDGWLDFIELPVLGATIYLNEDGKTTRRPLNTRATAFCWLYSARPPECPILLGDVVLTGTVDHEGTHDIEPLLEHLLIEPAEFVVQVSPEGDGIWHDSLACFDNFFDAALWCLLFGLGLRNGPLFRLSLRSPAAESVYDRMNRGGQPW